MEYKASQVPPQPPSEHAVPTTTEPLSDILRRKRKVRSQRVCQPCRVRKVKCDYETPCRTCRDRGHPELCHYDYEQPKKRNAANLAQSTRAPSHSHDEPRAELEDDDDVSRRLASMEKVLVQLQGELRALRSTLQHPTRARSMEASVDPSELMTNSSGAALGAMRVLPAETSLSGNPVYLGGNSVPAMVVALASDDAASDEVQKILEKSVLPVFCLDNESATYPFVDLWGIPHGSFKRIELLCKLLPASDAECMQVFGQYRETAHIIFPGVIDIHRFEGELLKFLGQRSGAPLLARNVTLAEQEVYGNDLHWLGLLFAMLASGVQCSVLPRKERQMKSQVYVCCAYECLRIVNYVSRATLVDLQTLIVLGNVLSNNMNAGVAWALLGLTIRLAQSLGLHYDPPSSDPSLPQSERSRIWWQIVWQDSLLSVTFDRAPPSYPINRHISPKLTYPLTYIDVMRRLCNIGLEIVQQRSSPDTKRNQLHRIEEWQDRIREDMQQMQPHLRDSSSCRTMREQLEYWNLYLHRSYIVSEMSRSVIHSRKTLHTDNEQEKKVRAMCFDSLANTVEAFLGLQNITNFATQSWAAVHRALSSALLLSILGRPDKEVRVQVLVSKLAQVFSAVIAALDPSELSAPLTRSVEALQKFASQKQKLSFAEDEELAYRDQNGRAAPHKFTPVEALSHSSISENEDSPHAVLNYIIWGSHDAHSTLTHE